MSVIFEKVSDKLNKFNDRLEAPKGWFTAEELEKNYVTNTNERPEETELFIKHNLPMAAKRAERLIDTLERKLNIEVPESYLRVRADTAFQVLLLVKHDDFVSPKIAAARLLAEEYSRTEAYDICFTFSVISESVVNTLVLPNEYKLKHIQQHVDNTTRN